MCDIYTMEYYSAIKKIMTFATTQMNLEKDEPRESQTEKDNYFI